MTPLISVKAPGRPGALLYVKSCYYVGEAIKGPILAAGFGACGQQWHLRHLPLDHVEQIDRAHRLQEQDTAGRQVRLTRSRFTGKMKTWELPPREIERLISLAEHFYLTMFSFLLKVGLSLHEYSALPHCVRGVIMLAGHAGIIVRTPPAAGNAAGCAPCRAPGTKRAAISSTRSSSAHPPYRRCTTAKR